MKRLVGLLLSLAILVTGCRGTPTTGAGLYARSCGACHGTGLVGATGPALGAGSEAVDLSDADYRRIVREGEGDMAAVTNLNDEQLALVIAHSRAQQSS
jgi:mono/diheme cytochrome c family protein